MTTSLSSFLLGKAKEVDNELDSLFKSAPKPLAVPTVKARQVQEREERPLDGKKKRKAAEQASSDEPSSKRSKAAAFATSPSKLSSTSAPALSSKLKSKTTPKSKSSGKKTKKPRTAAKDDSDEDEDSEEEELAKIEERYLAGRSSKAKAKGEKASDDEEADAMDEDEDEDAASDAPDSDNNDDEEDDGGGAIPVHESLQTKSSQPKSGKFAPADETPEQRDRRTVFIGNLPLAVAEKRPLQKQLQKHILALVPTAKIESVRFRSVPFQAPTSKLPDDATSDSTSKKPSDKKDSSSKVRQHDLDRASSWRSSNKSKDEDEDDESVKKDTKRYLTPNQKKKIAFINQEFHSSADSVNAYVVFAHPIDPSTRPKNLPPLPPTMDPYEAAKQAVGKCNGTVFMERVIRVDRVGFKPKGAKGASTEEEGEGGVVGALQDADPKLSIFVGNLDFESKEEDLRVFFETLLKSEKGAPGGGGEDGEEETMLVDGDKVIKKPKSWVAHVRIVRDRDTQLGKGFAYVQFADKDCVDEILAMDASKLKFAKRKLRVQRCKSVPGTSLKIKTQAPPTKQVPGSTIDKAKSAGKSANQTPLGFRNHRPTPIEVPKGDPSLGQRLAHLSKEARKDVKAKDADRVARRLAKKKARMAVGSDLKVKGGEKGKDRERVRNGGKKKGSGVNSGRKAGKPRVRSEKAAAKRNAKKD